MDLNDLLNKAPSHKRTSSKADNLNVDQPAPKHARGDGSSIDPTASSSIISSTNNPSQRSVEPRLQGVWVVLKLSGDPHDYDAMKTIDGVYASKKDAEARIEKERLEFINESEIDPDHIEEESGGAGWFWDDGNSELTGFSMESHKIIWPTPKSEATSLPSESSK